MKFNKKILKTSGFVFFSAGLCVGSVFVGQKAGHYFQKQNVQAQQETVMNSPLNKSVATNVDALTELNVLYKLTDELKSYETNQTVLTQDQLDSYLYYLVQYQMGNYEFYSIDDSNVSTFEDGLAILEKLYQAANVPVGFEWKINSDGEKESIFLTRDIKKPTNFDEVKADVQEKVENELSDKTVSDATKEVVVVETPDLVTGE